MSGAEAAPALRAAEPGLVSYTHAIYALHALSVLTGVLTSASIAGRFVFGLPSIIAVIMNYARRADARGTYLESHFAWQIRTFWFALLWLVLTLLVAAPLILIVVGIFLAVAGFALVGLWVSYRVARGWLALRAGHTLPMTPSPA
jgi:uncharacterized membrane protein